MGWYGQNSGGKLQPVGSKPPNPWGLYDMHGNVFEWCLDRSERPGEPDLDTPHRPGAGVRRYIKGGSFFSNPEECRAGFRREFSQDSSFQDIGFRVLIPVQTGGDSKV